MRRLLLATAAPIALAVGVGATAPAAESAVHRVGDGRGNTITFDVDRAARDVNVTEYARILRDALHGREIRTVRIRIVPPAQISRLCGSRDAAACYGGNRTRGTIIVPAGSGASVRHSLLHEYAHHIDASTGQGGDGTPRWFSARRMNQKLSQGQVAYSYARGWSRSIGEIFAEDYVQAHVRARFGIPWLSRPSTGVIRAIRRDITGSPNGTPPVAEAPSDAPGVGPGANRTRVTFPSRGRIAPGATARIPFGLLGPRRTVDFEADLTGIAAPASVRTTLVCEGRRITGAWGGDDKNPKIKRRGLGPAECAITLQNVGDGVVTYDADLTLTRPRSG